MPPNKQSQRTSRTRGVLAHLASVGPETVTVKDHEWLNPQTQRMLFAARP